MGVSKATLASFTPTQITGLSSTYKEGDTLTFKMTGEMKVKQGSKAVTWDVSARLEGGKLIGKATAAFRMTDFGFTPPDIAGVLKANDDVKATFEFVAVP